MTRSGRVDSLRLRRMETEEYWMFILMEVQMEQAHQQPQQSMAGWLEALMQTHWRSGQREQQECMGGLPEEMDS